MYLTTEFPVLGLTGNALSMQDTWSSGQINQSFGWRSTAVGTTPTTRRSRTSCQAIEPLGVRWIFCRCPSAQHAWRSARAGTLLQPEEPDEHGALAPAGSASLSSELWQTAFGGQPLIGQTLNVDGRPHEILGIMPPSIDVMDNRTTMWLPRVPRLLVRTADFHILHVIGRLKDGVTAQAARAEFERIPEEWQTPDFVVMFHRRTVPSRAASRRPQMQPVREAIVGAMPARRSGYCRSRSRSVSDDRESRISRIS